MTAPVSRRRFLAASTAAVAAAASPPVLARSAAAPRMRKALIGSPSEETFKAWKAAGFDGMETSAAGVAPAQAEQARLLAERHGMTIHSVLRGWTNVNRPDSFAADVASVETALRAAQGYGAGAVLWVPCRIGGMAMPEAWEFDIAFDEKTGHLTRVAAGDNARYADYIAAHNAAVDASRKAILQLIPTAEKTGVVIGIENVWNNLWVKPAVFANFVASFDSPWVQAYYDIGNHVKYAPSEEWIRALGKLTVRCHVKDFLLNADGRGGKFVDIRDGSVNWPGVIAELKKLGLDDMWMTIEGSEQLSLEERSRRLDLILAGK